MPKFDHQFFMGLLTGAALSGLLVFSFAYHQIQMNFNFADENMKLYFAAMDDIETLKSKCGSPCESIPLTNANLAKSIYAN